MPSRSSQRTSVAFPASLIVHAVCHARRSAMLRMVVDTGATYTMIPRKMALAVGLDLSRASRSIPIITASAVEYVPVLHMPHFRCLGIEFRNIEFVCHDLPSQSAVDGLLGLNVLRHFPPFQRFQRELHSFLVND